MTRVAYIGAFRPPYSTENQVAYALERVGCTVERIEQDSAEEWRVRREGVDLVLYTRTHNHTALLPQWTDIWRRCEQDGIVTAALHLDVFVGLAREHLLEERDPLFTVGHLFTADGSPECAAKMRAHGFNHHWLAPAVDERVLERTEESFARFGLAPLDVYDQPVVFVGSRYGYHGEHQWRQVMLDTLERRYGPRFVWYGNNAPDGTLRGPELDGLYASDRVLIGDSCFAGQRRDYWSDRVPETLARGGLLLHEDLPPAWYEHGRHYIAYDPDPDRLIAQVDFALALSPMERAVIKTQGRALVARRDTWTHRVGELLRVCGLAQPAEETA